MKWISVKKALPKVHHVDYEENLRESDRLLVWVKGEGVSFGRYRVINPIYPFTSSALGRWGIEMFKGDWEVTHWAKLVIPKGEKIRSGKNGQ